MSGKTHQSYGLSASNCKPLKPCDFKAFPDFSHTLGSQIRKRLYIYIYSFNPYILNKYPFSPYILKNTLRHYYC